MKDSQSAPAYLYAAFGLTIASDMALPELALARPGARPDVAIRLGKAPPIADGQPVEQDVVARPGALHIDFEPAAFLVLEGRRILVQPKPDAEPRDIRAYLLGSAMGAILHQRGVLPLHANAVEFSGRAVAFAGPSGAGKSTLAAWFRARGQRLLCDDVCAVSFAEGGATLAWPGIPRIKLWSDALTEFGHNPEELDRVVNWEDKFSLPISTDLPQTALPLECVYVLRTVERDPQITEVIGAAAFEAVTQNVYRSEFSGPLGQSAAVFRATVDLLKSVRVFIAERVRGFEQFDAQAVRLEQHALQRIARAPTPFACESGRAS